MIAQERVEVARAVVLEDVLEEREYQDKRFGNQLANSDLLWNAIAMEEAGEAAREIYEQGDNLYNEVIQCAAVYMAWAEYLYHRRISNENYC